MLQFYDAALSLPAGLSAGSWRLVVHAIQMTAFGRARAGVRAMGY